MFNIDKSIKRMIGNTKRGGKNDWDGDGVRNRKDCQPRNTMRQDSIKDIYGKKVSVGDTIVDENGNIGWVRRINQGERAIVDFGVGIGHDVVSSGDKIKKGKRW